MLLYKKLLLMTFGTSLVLSSHLRFGLPSDLFGSGFPTKTLCTHLPNTIPATFPAHLILEYFLEGETGRCVGLNT